ncbi:MAG: hypothetical protein ACRDF4_03600, partial [Rhabdochlamydiaceae bacterium]
MRPESEAPQMMDEAYENRVKEVKKIDRLLETKKNKYVPSRGRFRGNSNSFRSNVFQNNQGNGRRPPYGFNRRTTYNNARGGVRKQKCLLSGTIESTGSAHQYKTITIEDPSTEVEESDISVLQQIKNPLLRVQLEPNVIYPQSLQRQLLPINNLQDIQVQDLFCQDTKPVGGCLLNFHREWEMLVQDAWALELIQHGMQLQWSEEPYQASIPDEFHLSMEDQSLVTSEVESLLIKQAIEPVPAQNTKGFYSQLFVVPKKDGKHRPVIDCRKLNHFLHKEHFKMEGLMTVRDLIRPGDWMITIDIQDAYLHLPVHLYFQKYLRFIWQDQHY